MIKTFYWSSCKVSVIIVRFYWKFNFPKVFRKILDSQISWKSDQREPSCSIRTDMMKLIARIRNFEKALKKLGTKIRKASKNFNVIFHIVATVNIGQNMGQIWYYIKKLRVFFTAALFFSLPEYWLQVSKNPPPGPTTRHLDTHFLDCSQFADCYYILLEGRDSSVGKATSYGLDGRGIESRWGRDFLHPSRPVLVHPASYTKGTTFSRE